MSMIMSNSRWKQTAMISLAAIVLALAGYLCLVMINVYTVDVALVGAAEVIVEYGDDFEDPGAMAAYHGTIFQQEPLDVPVSVEGTVDLTKVGEYELRYSAEYEGLSGSAVRIVRVVDSVKPEVNLLGEEIVTLPVGSEYQEAGCTASDNYSGDLTEAVAVSGTLDPMVPGSYSLKYTARDESGNTASAVRTVVYADVTAPVITLLGDAEMELESGAVFEDPGFTAADDCDGDMTALVAVDGTVDTEKAGAYALVYTVTDIAGNAAAVQRTVTVKDLIPPELILSGDSTVTLFIGDSFEEPGYEAADNCDGDLTEQVQITGDLNMNVPGTYTVTYTVSDASGNTATATRTVIVCRGIVYLTYDDGPSTYTSALLDLLDQYGVKATFFLVDSGYADVVAREAASGHTIGIHSATHDYDTIYASEEAFFEDLYYMQSIIQSYTGQTPMITRFPGGSSNTVSWRNKGIMTRLTQLVEEKGFRYFDWNVGSHDASDATGWKESAQNVIRGITCQQVSVVLMHDSRATCTRATERIIEWGLENGYIFAPLTYDGPGCHHRVNN